MVTYRYRNGFYLTLINGRIEEAHADFVEFLESIRDVMERYEHR